MLSKTIIIKYVVRSLLVIMIWLIHIAIQKKSS